MVARTVPPVRGMGEKVSALRQNQQTQDRTTYAIHPTDLFVLNGATYIVIIDYFSCYPEVKLTSTTSQSIIAALKSIFARHRIPETFVSDNGPQYFSQEFAEFAEDCSFTYITSSPHYPQSNGQAECRVKTVKKVLTGSSDPCLSLL